MMNVENSIKEANKALAIAAAVMITSFAGIFLAIGYLASLCLNG